MKLSKEINSALLTSLTGKYALYVFQMASLAIISRLFAPEVFGVIAAFQVFILFFQMLATSSLTSAVVYEETISKEQRNGIFSFTFCVGVVGSILFFLITPFLASWLDIEGAETLSWVLAFNVLFSALSMMPMASLQKDTKFLLIARSEIIAELSSLAVCVFLYYQGYRLEALASKLMIVPIVRFTMYYMMSARTSIGRPFFGRDIHLTYKLFSVAKYQLAFNVLNFFSRNLDTLLITKYFGTHLTGVYEKSYQLMKYPLQLFTFAITPALQPVFTKYKKDPEVVESEYYRIIYRLALVGVFAATVLFWKAEELVFILFGPQWHETADILRLLSVTVGLQMVLSSTGGVYQAFGATNHMFRCGVFSSVLNVSFIAIGVWFLDIRLLCMLLAASFWMSFIQCFYTLHKRVFGSKLSARFYVLAFLITFPYSYLFFTTKEPVQVSDYFLSIQDIAIFSGVVGAVIAAIFLIMKNRLNSLARV